MLRHIHDIRYNRARRRELAGAASVKHGIAEHIAVYKDGIEHIVDIVERVCRR